jgi:hypothetical protein
MLVFSDLANALFRCLCTYSPYLPSTIIIDDSGDLRGPADTFMSWKPTERSNWARC